jgi:DNA-binding MarR family transcriptional regulator
MTNRLDRLEAAGLIRRLPDPNDRRGTVVEPTELGLRKWDEVVGAASRKESELTTVLTEAEKTRLHDLLRELMRAFPDWKHKKQAQPITETDD